MGQQLLRILAVVIIDMGVLFSILPFFDFGRDILFLLNPGADAMITTSGIVGFQLGMGLVGVLTTTWGLTLLGISYNYNPKMYRFILAAIIYWFVVDTIISIASGFTFNVVFNLVFGMLLFVGLQQAQGVSLKKIPHMTVQTH